MRSTATEDRQWWVIEAGNPSGPFNHAYIALRLNSGGINHDTLLCRVGETQWRPLSQWPEFSVRSHEYKSALDRPGSVPRSVPSADQPLLETAHAAHPTARGKLHPQG